VTAKKYPIEGYVVQAGGIWGCKTSEKFIDSICHAEFISASFGMRP